MGDPSPPASRRLGRRVAADHYVYALTDYREVDRALARARVTRVGRVIR